jgi:hypothetical protein
MVSEDLASVLDVMALMIDAEKIVSHPYQACAERFRENEELWKELVREELVHAGRFGLRISEGTRTAKAHVVICSHGTAKNTESRQTRLPVSSMRDTAPVSVPSHMGLIITTPEAEQGSGERFGLARKSLKSDLRVQVRATGGTRKSL